MTAPRLQPIRLDAYKPLREIVSDALRQAIRDGILPPGERLMEIPLAEELGVSRTPIREAIRILEQEGLIVMIPRRGTYVADMSLKDVTEVFELRSILEELAAELAAERITNEEIEALEQHLVEIGNYMNENNLDKVVQADILFHEILYKASRNDRLVEMIHNLREQTLRFRTLSMSQTGRLAKTWDEHRQLVEAISDRDVERARHIARIHMEESEKTLLAGMQLKGHED